MLEINPSKRITAEEALKHPYLESFHDDNDEPKFEGNINFDFESDSTITVENLKILILEEVNHFKSVNKEKNINISDAMKLCKKREENIKKH